MMFPVLYDKLTSDSSSALALSEHEHSRKALINPTRIIHIEYELTKE